MKKMLPLIIIGILLTSGFGAIAFDTSKEKIAHSENAYTHTILGEFGTATWCTYCKYAHAALKNIYAGGWHPFYYVSLVCDVNTHAYQRAITELGLTGYPTVYFDGGYMTNVGAGSTEAAQAAYNTSIVACGSRGVADIDLSLDIAWMGPGNPSPINLGTDEPVESCLNWTDAEMNIEVTVDNNEGGSYNGRLRTYVTEVVTSMGWIDSAGLPYTFPFLDYAFNEDITISAGGTWQNDVNWDGYNHDNGYGDNYAGITQDNIMVIAAVFNDANDYVDETVGLLAGVDTDPKTYDVYFGTSNPPPKVASNQSDLEYCPPDILDFDTTYYWKIVVWDNQGNSKIGPIWSFTTRGNDAPNTPSNPDPNDEETEVPINTNLHWTGGDPDDDEVTYDVYFGTTNPPPQVTGNQSSTTYNPPGLLDFETTYYWKIVAWDIYGYSTTGPIWEFTTQENQPPNTPSDPDPEDGATNVAIDEIVKCTGGDPNPGDTVKYDIYFGTTSPPPLAIEDSTQAAYDPGTMNLNTTYYWQIISRDSQGLETIGPIWHFTTELEPNDPPGKPTINGPITGNPGKTYDYTLTAYDTDGDDIRFQIDWGDTETETTTYITSGTYTTVSHTWTTAGTYTITAKAQDTKGATGPEETLSITIKKSKNINTQFYKILQNILQQYPILKIILQKIII